jgi:uncharacterized protein (DUF427 family)
MSEERGRLRVEQGAKRVRVYLGGVLLADTIAPRHVWENPSFPAYYIPREDVRMDLLEENGHTKHSPSRGEGVLYTARAGGKESEDAALVYPDSPLEELRGLVRFDWEAVDNVFEEDEEVFIHPRSPYSRVDILPSSRHVEVSIDGTVVADSHQPMILFETGLPPRYYLPKSDVRMDLLTETDSTSGCPYKGFARYWSFDQGTTKYQDVVWSYATPLPESQRVAGRVCFYDERVDIKVDGVLQERPRTKFS